MKVIYQAENGELFDTETECLLAECIESSSLYLEKYKIKEVVKIISENFHIHKIIPAIPVGECVLINPILDDTKDPF